MAKAVKKAAKRQKLAIPAEAARKLRVVAKHILEEPRRLYMDLWVVRRGEEPEHDQCVRRFNHSYAKCGTAACIAGWTTLLFTPTERIPSTIGFEPQVAARLLKLTFSSTSSEDDLSKLFFRPHWPVEYKDRYASASSPRARAKVAAERIEHFILTGE